MDVVAAGVDVVSAIVVIEDAVGDDVGMVSGIVVVEDAVRNDIGVVSGVAVSGEVVAVVVVKISAAVEDVADCEKATVPKQTHS